MSLSLKIVTPERVAYEATVDSITAMTQDGEITVLPGHAPLVSALRPGEARVKVGADESFLALSTGFLQVRPDNEIVIIADHAERMEELELEAVKAAKERAKALMEEKRHIDDVAFAGAAALMERELAREKVALRRHHARGPHIESQP
ncbi:ATP synthase F1 subunit epsilon [Patescibacteria group bacterium]|nr:MAG: ATP synthase F1 subunit epsilon [Patescibacteria group bacterium]